MRRWILAVGLSLLLTLLAAAALLLLARWNLEALARAPPLSWAAVGLVWAYAVAFTLITLLLLVAVAALLLAAEVGCRDDPA
jgi:heme/copper-type cytochrome/quinol oxidase subunit 2